MMRHGRHRRHQRRLGVVVGAVITGVVVTGCQWPRDVDGTVERVRGGTLRVGVVQSEPWVSASGSQPTGVEVRLVAELAQDLDAQVSWAPGPTAELVSALHDGALDLVVGGLTAQDPWTQEVSFTRPYVSTRTLVAVPEGGVVLDSVDGQEVRLEADPQVEGLLLAEGALPRIVEDAGAGTGPVAVQDWELEELGLVETDVQLHSQEHVMAVRMGENAWQVQVERYLLNLEPAHVQDLLREES